MANSRAPHPRASSPLSGPDPTDLSESLTGGPAAPGRHCPGLLQGPMRLREDAAHSWQWGRGSLLLPALGMTPQQHCQACVLPLGCSPAQSCGGRRLKASRPEHWSFSVMELKQAPASGSWCHWTSRPSRVFSCRDEVIVCRLKSSECQPH